MDRDLPGPKTVYVIKRVHHRAPLILSSTFRPSGPSKFNNSLEVIVLSPTRFECSEFTHANWLLRHVHHSKPGDGLKCRTCLLYIGGALVM